MTPEQQAVVNAEVAAMDEFVTRAMAAMAALDAEAETIWRTGVENGRHQYDPAWSASEFARHLHAARNVLARYQREAVTHNV